MLSTALLISLHLSDYANMKNGNSQQKAVIS